MLYALNRPQTTDTGEDALDALDQMLMLLMGAVDVSARVACEVLGLQATGFPRWQDKRFRNEVRTQAPALADLFHGTTPHRLIIKVLARLRNTIHGAALPEIRVRESVRRESTWVGLPTAHAEMILRALDDLGGRDDGGVKEPAPGDYRVDLGMLADQIIVHTINLLRAVQDATPVERLVNVTPGHAPEPDPTHELLGVEGRRRVRLQLGRGERWDTPAGLVNATDPNSHRLCQSASLLCWG